LIALMQGLSQSLYYTVYKTIITDIANNSYGKYFAFARAGECTIGFICGIVFAEMIDNKNLGFSAVFVVLIISSIFALISSLFIKVKSRKKRQPHFRLVKFMKHTYNRHALYRVWAATICYGLTEGGLLAVLVNLVISINTSGNKTIGYLSSAVSLFAILYSFMHKRYINESNFKERLLPASIISFIIAIPLAFTGNILAIVAFRFISAALTGSILIERNRTTYDLITTITSPRYRKEYFYINEVMLDISRIVSMAMIFIVMHYTNDASNLTYLFIIGTIGYFIAILLLNGLYKYYYVGPCEEAKNEMKKDETE